MTSLNEVIAAARSTQLEENDGMGVGVQVGEGDNAAFVQWTTEDGAALVLGSVEVQPAGSGVKAELTRRGFAVDPEYGLMTKEVSRSFATEADFVAHIADLLRLVGAADGMKLIAFP